MNLETILENFKKQQTLSVDEIFSIRTEDTLRAELVEHFRTHRNRPFALALLNKFIELREDLKNEISINDLMLASFILGRQGKVEDSLKVWEAKRVDFDTYCGVDIQLVPFAGVNETIAFLETQNDAEVKAALEYVTACADGGDFDELEEYYNDSPWWI